jgi:predicted phage replisome organizer
LENNKYGVTMSDNKKYYYLKLKDNYFDQDNVKILESLPNGQIYSLIIMKMYVKSLKYDGQLKMTADIPYDPDKVNILASVIGHDIDHVKEAIRVGSDLGIITITTIGELWMTDIQNFIGHSSTEADRIRDYRKKLKSTNVQLLNDKSTPERDIEIKKDIEKDIYIDEQPKIDKDKDKDIKHIFAHWKSQGNLINHRQLTSTIKTTARAKLKYYTVEDITNAITNYSKIKDDEKYWFSHSYELKRFLEKMDTFLTESKPFENYRNNDKLQKPEIKINNNWGNNVRL